MAKKHSIVIDIKRASVDLWWAGVYMPFSTSFRDGWIGTMKITTRKRNLLKRMAADSNGRIEIREEK